MECVTCTYPLQAHQTGSPTFRSAECQRCR